MEYMKSSGLFLCAFFFLLPFSAAAENSRTTIEKLGGENPPAILTITADIPKTEVYINGHYEGLVPQTLDPAPPGLLTIALIRDGYHHETFTADAVSGEHRTIRVELRAKTGSIVVEGAPDGLVCSIPGIGPYVPGTGIPEGEYQLRIGAFGYISQTTPVFVRYGQETIVDGRLQSAPFQLESFKAQERSYNPESSTPLIFTVSATAPGTARIVITDIEGHEVRTLDSDVFTARTTNILWDGKNSLGITLPDGLYTATVTLEAADGIKPSGTALTDSIPVYIDRSVVYRYSSSVSGTGSTGPVMSASLMRPAAMAVTVFSHFTDEQVTPGLSFVAGITRNLEAGVMAAVPVEQSGAGEIDYTLSVKTGFSSPLHSLALGLAYNRERGILAGPAYELRIAFVTLGVHAQAILSGNGGILYKPDVSAAAGFALRAFRGPVALGGWFRMESAPFGSNLTLDEQLSSGIMIKFLVPGTGLFISGDGAAHWSGSGGTAVYSGTAAFGLHF